jgi:hypothetical protein
MALVITSFPSPDAEANMRAQRDRFLADSDWTQMPDSPLTVEQRQAWADYRQALRDAPANWVPASTWDAPDPPVS